MIRKIETNIAWQLSPAINLHPSWINEFCSMKTYYFMISNKRSMQCLNNFISDRMSIKASCDIVNHPLAIFLAIKYKKLEEFLILVGMSYNYKTFLNVIDKKGVRYLLYILGWDGYDFITKCAPLAFQNKTIKSLELKTINNKVDSIGNTECIRKQLARIGFRSLMWSIKNKDFAKQMMLRVDKSFANEPKYSKPKNFDSMALLKRVSLFQKRQIPISLPH